MTSLHPHQDGPDAPTPAVLKTSTRMPVVALGVRSQEEEPGKDSAGDQMRIAREAALAEPGRFLYAEHVDHGSGFRGNRGKETEAALEDATRAAAEHGSAELWVFKSERLGRGSGRKDEARSVLEVYVEMRRAGVDLRSVEDDAYFTNPMLVGVADEMAHKYSRDLSAHVRRGKRLRHELGRASGPVHDGYMLAPELDGHGNVKTTQAGVVIFSRIHDPKRKPIVLRMFDAAEAGASPGEIARSLNRDGLRTVRGKQWTARHVRETLSNRYYAGFVTMHGEERPGDHDALLDADRFDAIQVSRKRMDPAALQRRKGGRPPADQSYILRGVAFCAKCGESMYTRRYAGGRHYVCAAVREARGTCDAQKVNAALLENTFLNQFEDFHSSLRGWLNTRADAHNAERAALQRAVDAHENRLAVLRRTLDKVEAHYLTLVAESDDLAPVALRQLAKVESDHQQQDGTLSDARARLEEWTPGPSTDAWLTLFAELNDLFAGRVSRAQSAEDLNALLASILEGVWVAIDRHGYLGIEATLTDAAAPAFDSIEKDQSWCTMLPAARMVELARRAEPDETPWCTTTR